MNRRKFIKKTSLAALSIGIPTAIYSWQVEPFWVEIVKQKMNVRNLPHQWLGRSIIQISDLHIGNRFDYSYILETMQTIQLQQPDLVVYTGDFVTYENEQQLQQLKDASTLFLKGKVGTYAVLGNHDYGFNWSDEKLPLKITNILEDAGITVLRNEIQEIDGLTIIGLDDFWGTNFEPELALKLLDRDAANVVLCHNPDVCDLAIWNGYDGWILSGHTHGGQVKPPFLDPFILPIKNKKYTSGKIELDDGRTLYINRAIGHLRQIRFNVRPEITEFELVSHQEEIDEYFFTI